MEPVQPPLSDMSGLRNETNLLHEADLHRDLFLRVGSLHRRHLMDILAVFDMTTGQYHALNMIAQHGPGCTMSQLAAATYHVLPTMTGIIKRLAEQALVEQRPDDQDRRTRRVFLTEAGQALLAQIDRQRQRQAIEILEHFTPADRHELLRLMQLYLDAVNTIDLTSTQTPED
ncbi:MarR family winged helix-turn-helix transcriptional regulator [Chloroflexota bacterium]